MDSEVTIVPQVQVQGDSSHDRTRKSSSSRGAALPSDQQGRKHKRGASERGSHSGGDGAELQTLSEVYLALKDAAARRQPDAVIYLKDQVLAIVEDKLPQQLMREQTAEEKDKFKSPLQSVLKKPPHERLESKRDLATDAAEFFSNTAKCSVYFLSTILSRPKGCPLRQTVTAMMRAPCTHGLLTDALLFLFLRLRRVVSMSGEVGLRGSADRESAKWVLYVHVVSWDAVTVEHRHKFNVFTCIYNWLGDAVKSLDDVVFVKELQRLQREVTNRGGRDEVHDKGCALLHTFLMLRGHLLELGTELLLSFAWRMF